MPDELILGVGTGAGDAAAGNHVHTGASIQGAAQTTARIAGRYAGPLQSISGAGFVMVANTIYYAPWHQPGGPIDRLCTRISTGAASSTVRLGIATANAAGVPDAVLLDGGTVDSSATNNVETTVSATLPAGLVWLMMKAEGGTPTVLGFAPTVATMSTSPNIGATTLDLFVRLFTVDYALVQTGAPAGAFVAPGTLAGGDQTKLLMSGVRWA